MIFEHFGIRTLSPSQLAKWSEDRGVWYAKHVAKVPDDAGPAAWRGDAIEFGLYAAMSGKSEADALKAALDTFAHREAEWAKLNDGEVHPDADEARAVVSLALPRAVAAFEGYGRPVSYQGKVEARLSGVEVPIFGKFDFAFALPGGDGRGAYTEDLKTTGHLPSDNQGPKWEHALAASLYAYGRGDQEARIVYVSTADKPKIPFRRFTLSRELIDGYVERARDIARAIQTTLMAAHAMSDSYPMSPEQALAELCRPNLLAQGGGVFPVWKADFQMRAYSKIAAWAK